MKQIKYEPLGAMVLVKPDELDEEEITDGGIIIPKDSDTKRLEKMAGTTGMIIDYGPLAWRYHRRIVDGKEVEGLPWVKRGDRVLFAKYGGKAIDIEGERYLILNDEDILCKEVEI